VGLTLTEADIVFRDKLGRYLAMGFNEYQSETLADRNDVYWKDVQRRLIDRGCPVDLAFCIVF
jgi:hypothetical protein